MESRRRIAPFGNSRIVCPDVNSRAGLYAQGSDILNPMPAPGTSVNSISLQERDLAILRGLFEARVMNTSHVAALYFDQRKEAAWKRLQKLKAEGLILEHRRNAFARANLFLTRKGHHVLRASGVLAEYPPLSPAALAKRSRVSEFTLRHELEVMDVKAAIHVEICKTGNLAIQTFDTWPLLYRFKASRDNSFGSDEFVQPDAFIRIHENTADGHLDEHSFFLEVDRSSESLDTLIGKAERYVDYYRRGGFAERNGGRREQFQEYPFLVLMVFKTAERRNNFAVRLLQLERNIGRWFLLSTLPEVIATPLGAIWMRPSEYRSAMKDTAFDPEKDQVGWGYQRNVERDRLAREKVVLVPLFQDLRSAIQPSTKLAKP